MIENCIEQMIKYFGKDVRRINHALKVYGFASCIARRENVSGQDALIVDVCALLHDIGIKEAERKYNSASGYYQEKEGPAIARELLSGLHLDDKVLDRICFIIGSHHSYNKIDGIDFQILVEADFLVNIYEDAMQGDAVQLIFQKHFKTGSGKEIFKAMYLNGCRKKKKKTLIILLA